MRIDKKGYDKGMSELEQALQKCSLNDGLRAWGLIHGCSRTAKLMEESSQVQDLITALENVIAYSRQRK